MGSLGFVRLARTLVRSFGSLGLNGVADLIASIAATTRSRERVRIHQTNGSWIHQFGDQTHVLANWYSTPRYGVEHHHDVFFHEYRPKLGDTVIDVGAGTGTEVVLLSRLVGTTGLVVAIEANPVVFERLCCTIRLNQLSNVVPLHLALTETSGIINIQFDSDTDPEGVGGRVSAGEGFGGTPVLGIPLPTLLDLIGLPRVDYLKMNIEGSEGPVLRSAVKSLTRVQHWCVSCHDFLGEESMRTFDVVCASLRAAGFSPFSQSDGPPSDSRHYYVYANLAETPATRDQ